MNVFKDLLIICNIYLQGPSWSRSCGVLGLDTSINTILYGNSDSAYNHVSCSDR
jgi:hypothetical protein